MRARHFGATAIEEDGKGVLKLVWLLGIGRYVTWFVPPLVLATVALADDLNGQVGQAGWFDGCCVQPEFLGLGIGLGVSRYQPPSLSLPSLGPDHVFRSDAVRTRFEFSQSAAWTGSQRETAPLAWQLSISQSRSTATTSGETALASDDPVFLSYGTPPAGHLELQTSADATGVTAGALVMVTDSAGGTASIVSTAFSPPGGAVTQSAISTTINGGALVSLLTDGDSSTATAHGAIYDDGGIAFVGFGDMGNTTFRTSSSDETSRHRMEVAAAWQIPSASIWTVTAKAGPVLSAAKRRVHRTETIAIAPTVPLGTPVEIGISARDTLTTRSYGATGGLTVSRPLDDDWYITLGASLSLERFHARHRGRASIEGVHTGHIGEAETRSHRTGLTRHARLEAQLSRAIGQGGVISLSVFGVRGAGLPTLSVSPAQPSGPQPITLGGTTTLTSTGSTAYHRTEVTTDTSWEVGVGVALIYRF